MPTPQPAYPTQHAFVVQIHAEADMAQGEVRGRVEHIVTGQATHFETVEALVQFIMKVLTPKYHGVPHDADGADA